MVGIFWTEESFKSPEVHQVDASSPKSSSSDFSLDATVYTSHTSHFRTEVADIF